MVPKSSLGRPAAGLPRYYMDCGWYRHPKFRNLPVEALFLFEAGIGYCTEHASDGAMAGDVEQLSLDLGVRLAIVRKGVKALTERGIWRADGDTMWIVGFADHNPTKAELDEYLESRSRSGVLGNHKRWHEGKGRTDADCPFCESHDGSQVRSQPESDSDRTSVAKSSHGMGWDGNPPPTSSAVTQVAPATDDRGGGRRTNDDRLDRVWSLLAERKRKLADELAGGPGQGVRTPATWLPKVAADYRARFGAEAAGYLERFPHWTTERLADELDPETAEAQHRIPTWEETQARQRAEAEAFAAEDAAAKAEADAIWDEILALPDAAQVDLRRRAAAAVSSGSERLIRARMRVLHAEAQRAEAG